MCSPISSLNCLMINFFPAATLGLQVNEAGSVTAIGAESWRKRERVMILVMKSRPRRGNRQCTDSIVDRQLEM